MIHGKKIIDEWFLKYVRKFVCIIVILNSGYAMQSSDKDFTKGKILFTPFGLISDQGTGCLRYYSMQSICIRKL